MFQHQHRTRARAARILTASALAAAAALAGSLAPSGAAPSSGPDALATGVLSPQSVAIADDGTVYYSSNFGGKLYELPPDGEATEIYSSPSGKEVGGISVDGEDVYFIHNFSLMKRDAEGAVTSVANFNAYEKAENPDGGVTYGVRTKGKRCLSDWPKQAGPAKYKGIVESHPYATEVVDGTVYVADAAANAIFAVSDGEISVETVVKPASFKITRALAKQFGLPKCVVGEKYWVEGVPTDVELGPDGSLYFTSLPGGPGVVPIGSVRKLNLETGAVTTRAGKLADATGFDIAENGDIYVTELFKGVVTRLIAGGGRETWVEIKQPAALEISGSELFLTSHVLTGLEGGAVKGKVLVYGL